MDQNSLYNEHPEQYSVCLTIRAQMQDYIEGYLDAVAAEAVRAHIAVCGLCSREHAELIRTMRLVHTLPFMAPMRDLAPGILSAIKPQSQSRWSRLRARFRPRDR
ncbi:MAG: hypothetical protein HUU17_11050 [Chthonomonadales bacterium]|nr:hypothetical protein [Chthonomonadales bacterium]